MRLEKAVKRDTKIKRKKYGPQVDNKSIFELERIQREKAKKIRKQRQEKQKLQEGADV